MASEREQQKEFEDSQQVSSIISALNEQRVSAKLCDVVLRISGDELYAHSNVLAAASPYFDNLFSGPDLPRSFSQKSPQIIEIHIDGEKDAGYGIAVQRVVDFMYTARISIGVGVLPQIMEIANIMQMTSIMGFCEIFKEVGNEKIDDINNKEKLNEKIDDINDKDKGNEIEQDMKEKSEKHELFEVSKGDNDKPEALTFQKKLKDKPTVLYIETSEKKKRGRPRKEVIEKISVSEKEIGNKSLYVITNERDDISIVNEEGNNGESDSLEEQNKSESAISGESKFKRKVKAKRINKPAHRVSRSGRIIKPKLFSDAILTSIKREDDFESNIKQEVMDEIEMDVDVYDNIIDSDVDDPSFRVPKVIKSEPDQIISFQVKKYACEKCDVIVSRLKDFHEHNRVHMHAEKKCSFCGWVCEDDEAEFEKHLNNHNGPKPFFCNFCSIRFKTRAQLFLHLPKHSKAKPFVCGLCNTGFKWKHALKSHMITHQDTKDYLCDICGFATAHKTQLKSHRLIHTGETYKCPEEGCSYQATKKTNLQFHILTHTREKPHQCEICGTSFSLVKNMKRHMLLHKADRPYKCDRCTFCSTRFDKLKEHYFKQHNIGEKPGKRFTWAEYLQQEESGFESLANTAELEEKFLESIEESMETIELEVAAEESGSTTTQILNLTSSTGENIPITITQVGADISYEIPVHVIGVEGVTDQE